MNVALILLLTSVAVGISTTLGDLRGSIQQKLLWPKWAVDLFAPSGEKEWAKLRQYCHKWMKILNKLVEKIAEN